jgi:hypothetical protein
MEYTENRVNVNLYNFHIDYNPQTALLVFKLSVLIENE